MRVLILGGDGYLGWPTAMAFRRAGHEVFVIDNYLRRKIATETDSDALMLNPRLPERVAIFTQKATATTLNFYRASSKNFYRMRSFITRSSRQRPIR
jgi:nucleoside-diphosphate-sugar epimerase